ncbi:polygalacturonase-like [Canna indica]|uniref:Polygalacturonase-like n=1 Tax=Canna indica TaxID=4628 RepID=A0AAQ3JXJ3_9LILI|nr:polygalacturonase-like [Canna indica]
MHVAMQSLVFRYVTNATIVTLLDPKIFHMQVFKSNYVTFNSIRVTAPGDSPNTDGLHIAESSNIVVNNAVVDTGDDCISIGPGNRNLSITGVTCGPGHGISVGSLSKTPGENDVVGLSVRNCTFIGTSNGLRIKSWQSSVFALKASGFHYEDIVMMYTTLSL